MHQYNSFKTLPNIKFIIHSIIKKLVGGAGKQSLAVKVPLGRLILSFLQHQALETAYLKTHSSQKKQENYILFLIQTDTSCPNHFSRRSEYEQHHVTELIVHHHVRFQYIFAYH